MKTRSGLRWDAGLVAALLFFILVSSAFGNPQPPPPDTDGDGLSGAQEVSLGTNPNNPDTDGDQLSDGDEVHVFGTDPLNPDEDGDDLPDGWEWKHFGTFARDGTGDYDEDALSDAAEYDLGSDPNTIKFTARFDNFHVNSTYAFATVEVESGVPHEMAVLVDATEPTANDWVPFFEYALAVLGPNDGDYEVSIALRGRAGDESEAVWDYNLLTGSSAARGHDHQSGLGGRRSHGRQAVSATEGVRE